MMNPCNWPHAAMWRYRVQTSQDCGPFVPSGDRDLDLRRIHKIIDGASIIDLADPGSPMVEGHVNTGDFYDAINAANPQRVRWVPVNKELLAAQETAKQLRVENGRLRDEREQARAALAKLRRTIWDQAKTMKRLCL